MHSSIYTHLTAPQMPSQLTTLVLLLLYEVDFKRPFSKIVMRHYPMLLDASPPHVGNTMNRLTIHLFNLPVQHIAQYIETYNIVT